MMQVHSGWCLFFKQKTAYEMRISDWSSDVCSSDLRRLTPLVAAPLFLEEQGIELHSAVDEQGGADDVVGIVGEEPGGRAGDVLRLADAAIGDLLHHRRPSPVVAPVPPIYVGLDPPGRNRVYQAALRRQFLRHLSDAPTVGTEI